MHIVQETVEFLQEVVFFPNKLRRPKRQTYFVLFIKLSQFDHQKCVVFLIELTNLMTEYLHTGKAILGTQSVLVWILWFPMLKGCLVVIGLWHSVPKQTASLFGGLKKVWWFISFIGAKAPMEVLFWLLKNPTLSPCLFQRNYEGIATIYNWLASHRNHFEPACLLIPSPSPIHVRPQVVGVDWLLWAQEWFIFSAMDQVVLIMQCDDECLMDYCLCTGCHAVNCIMIYTYNFGCRLILWYLFSGQHII